MRSISLDRIFGLFLISGFILSACKKDSNTSATNNTSGSTIITTSQPSSANLFSGIFAYEQDISFTKTTNSYSVLNYFTAYFSNTPVANINTSTYLMVDTVRVNSSVMGHNTYYYDLSSTLNFPLPLYWTIRSQGSIPSFVYANPDSLPRYNGYQLLPDSINRSDSLALNFANLYNTDSLTLEISVSSGIANTFTSTVMPPNIHSATVTIAQTKLSNLSPSQNGYIAISLQRTNRRKIGGKDYKFTTTLVFKKWAVVII